MVPFAEQALRLLVGPDATAALIGLLSQANGGVQAALAVSQRIDELVRRERELTALYQTAGDLPSRRDVQKGPISGSDVIDALPSTVPADHQHGRRNDPMRRFGGWPRGRFWLDTARLATPRHPAAA